MQARNHSAITWAAGCLAALLCALPAAAAEKAETALTVRRGKQSLTILDGKRTVLEYRFAEVPFKPYVSRFLTPAGVNVLRDAPHDHRHHHGLMFACKAGGVDFWGESKRSGRQVHREFTQVTTTRRGTAEAAAFCQRLEWVGPDDKPILQERRTVEVYRSADLRASLLTWRTTLRPAEGRKSVKLGGSHYHGLGMRFVASMDKAGRFVGPTGKMGPVVRGTERLTPGAWFAYAAAAGEGKVTAAMLDSPGNARPALWFTMTAPFAYLSATVNLWKKPLTVTADEPGVFCYGVALWDGEAKGRDIESLRATWRKLSAAAKP